MAKPSDKMYRYLEKYVGKYRVLAEYDLSTGDFPREEDGSIDESFEDLYIPCAKGRILSTYILDTLVWYTDSLGQGRNVRREIDSKYNGKLEYQYEETDADVLIYFNEADIKKIATLVKPRTSGAKIKPFSNKNLPKPLYEIPEEDDAKFNKITEGMDRIEKMQFVRNCCSAFDEIIQKKKGKNFDVSKERRESRLKPKAFISYIGLWDEFLKFAREYYKEYKNEK